MLLSVLVMARFARRVFRASLVAAICLACVARSFAEPESAPVVTPEQEKFFEEKVRPVLATQCYKCHGAQKQESGLRLDSRGALLEGGDSGERAVVPGEPDRSLLVKAVNHLGDVQMPPETKLPPDQIEALTTWVKIGLPWPKSASDAGSPLSAAERVNVVRRSHWSLQEVVRPAVPDIKDPAWSHSPLDAFVLARLDAAGLTPSQQADRRTLIRRLSFDLLGLPPTPEEVSAFIADSASDAYERLVDRLLASPRYGERWGRHWLDVARYADTRGYAFAKERRYPYSYTYRDYVIDSLNRDLPYDRFIVEQLAADRLPLGEDKSSLAAMGFLTTGRKFNNQHDDIDDQIDVVARGLLGLTVACARCHDHKYDAIPTEDYYSLYGVFASSEEPNELPLIGPPGDGEAYEAFERELKKHRDEAEKYTQEKHAELLDIARKQSAEYLARVLVSSQEVKLLQALSFLSLNPNDIKPRLVERWKNYFAQHAKPDHPALGAWHDLANLPDEGFVERAAPILAKLQGLATGTAAGQVNPLVKAAFAAEPPIARPDLAKIYGKLFSGAFAQWQQAGASDEAFAKLPEDVRQLAEILLGKDSPTDIPAKDAGSYLSRADRNKLRELEKKVESFQASSPLAPPRGMVLVEKSQPVQPRVFIRGNHARPGKPVPRQYLSVLSGSDREPFQEGSGRLELAQKIVTAENPLTRRVIVNRVWMHHFGEPLVATPSDFGIRSDPPTHPELLDYLASKLLESGWSLKDLHREIVGSSTYRQASIDRPDCQRADPENRLLWKMNRRRLELEAMRDSLLAYAGRLDSSMHGRPVELTKSPFSQRRTVYGYLDRQDLPNFFRVFDIASPDQSNPRRPRTTVPQQALFFMNSPFVIEQSQSLAARSEIASLSDPAQKISAFYQIVLNRPPDADELAIGQQFVASATASSDGVKLSPWEQYAQLLLLTNEVMYID